MMIQKLTASTETCYNYTALLTTIAAGQETFPSVHNNSIRVLTESGSEDPTRHPFYTTKPAKFLMSDTFLFASVYKKVTVTVKCTNGEGTSPPPLALLHCSLYSSQRSCTGPCASTVCTCPRYILLSRSGLGKSQTEN